MKDVGSSKALTQKYEIDELLSVKRLKSFEIEVEALTKRIDKQEGKLADVIYMIENEYEPSNISQSPRNESSYMNSPKTAFSSSSVPKISLSTGRREQALKERRKAKVEIQANQEAT